MGTWNPGPGPTEGDDIFQGGDASETAEGGGGWDRLDGGSGADTLRGGEGSDVLSGTVAGTGSEDADELFGEAGDDRLYGGILTRFDGGDGNDDVRLYADNATGPVRFAYSGVAGETGTIFIDGIAAGSLKDIESLVFYGGDFADQISGGFEYDELYGANGDDQLSGGLNGDNLTGGAGEDVLRGGDSNDTLSAGDYLEGSIESDRLYGDEGDDFLYGGARTVFDGGAGFDFIQLHAEDAPGAVSFKFPEGSGARGKIFTDGLITGRLKDVERLEFFGSAFGDRVSGGSSFDRLRGESGDDDLSGGGKNDSLIGGSGDDKLHGGNDNDQLAGGAFFFQGSNEKDSLFGDAGSDTLYGGARTRFDGGTGFDRIFLYSDGATGAVSFNYSGIDGDAAKIFVDGIAEGNLKNIDQLYFFGSEFNDDVSGGIEADIFEGGDGDDQMAGGGGGDQLIGETGDDVLRGGASGDVLSGDMAGRGSSQADQLYGEDGGDRLYGGARTHFDGGTGFDITELFAQDSLEAVSFEYSGVLGESASILLDGVTAGSLKDIERLIFHGSELDDDAGGGLEQDQFFGGGGHDRLSGGDGDDDLTGDAGDDDLLGGAGVDDLLGGLNDDRLDGGIGNDRLYAGEGRDISVGGAGSDTFVFRSLNETQFGSADLIEDYESGDILDLWLIDADLTAEGDQQFHIGDRGTAGSASLAYDADRDLTILSVFVDNNESIDGEIWFAGDKVALLSGVFSSPAPPPALQLTNALSHFFTLASWSPAERFFLE